MQKNHILRERCGIILLASIYSCRFHRYLKHSFNEIIFFNSCLFVSAKTSIMIFVLKRSLDWLCVFEFIFFNKSLIYYCSIS
jgi:hypothetical protein